MNAHRGPHEWRDDCRTCFCTIPEPSWPRGTCVALGACKRCEGTGCTRSTDDRSYVLASRLEQAEAVLHRVSVDLPMRSPNYDRIKAYFAQKAAQGEGIT